MEHTVKLLGLEVLWEHRKNSTGSPLTWRKQSASSTGGLTVFMETNSEATQTLLSRLLGEVP